MAVLNLKDKKTMNGQKLMLKFEFLKNKIRVLKNCVYLTNARMVGEKPRASSGYDSMRLEERNKKNICVCVYVCVCKCVYMCVRQIVKTTESLKTKIKIKLLTNTHQVNMK